jgi:glutathione S-transferase
MKLLYTKRSPYARKVRVIALEKGINLEYIDEDLQNKSQRLLDANPLGKVPTLVLDDGKTIYDSRVIAQYLDTLNDKARMIPKAGEDRFKVLQWEALSDDMMSVAINAYMEKIRHPKDVNAAFLNAQEKNLQNSYKFIEENLHHLREFSLAPVAIASAIGYIQFRLPHLSVEGKLKTWYEDFCKRPSMAQTIPVA